MTGNPPYTESVPLTTTAIAGGTSRNFSISFAPTAVGTFTGSISIANSDSSGSESPYVVNFTGVGVLPAPEIRLERFDTTEIPSGSAASFSFDTVLTGQVIGVTSPAKTYTIRNTGTANLTLFNPVLSAGNTGDFTVSTATSLTIAPAGTATFTVSFTPTYLGTRTATISIANNDLTGGENPYLFNVSGDGSCAVTTNTATPASGPVGTEVTITATTGNLNNATVTFNGVSQPTVTYVNSSPTTIIKVIVPSGATSGNLITTNANGCSTSSTFTVLNNVANTCQGGNVATELFMSEVTDSNSGALSYVEIYNGTGVTKNLASYSLKTANNGGAYGFTLLLSNVNLLPGNTYVVALGNDSSCSGIPGGNGSYAAQSSLSGSVNFNSGGHDHIGLFNGASLIDSWGVFGSNNWASTSFGPEGVSFRRKNTATLPNITFSNSDWNIIDFLENTSAYCANNDYTDIGIYNFLSGTPPTVTIHPIYTPTCKAASLTVAGTEGYNVAGLDTQELGYQWFVSIPPATGWTALTNGAIYTGVTTATLNISNVSGLTNNQYYCQIQENTSTCYAASNAVKIIDGVTVTWNGTWIGGSPTFNKAVIIDADYDMNLPLPSFEACSVTVNTGRIVTITDGKYVSILNDLTVVGTGNVIVKDNGSLVQIYDSGVNTGEIDVKRIATIKKKDYVYWSSPVSGFLVTSISPGTPSTLIWKWEPLVVSNGFEGNWVNPATPTMAEGVGYIVRGPGAFNNTTATDLTAPFRGVPLNGIKQPSIVKGTNMGVGIDYGGSTRTERDDNYNLVGNPYASAISANDFLVTNAKTGTNTSGGIEGFIYLWSHGSLPAILTTDPFYNNYVYNYNPNDYITYNLMGASCGACFNGYVASGQSFFVVKDAVTTANTVTFNNSMRRNSTLGTYYDNSNFFRTAITTSTLDNQAAPKSRIWLDLIGPTPANESTRMLVGYSSEATFAKDVLYDANTKVGTNQNFYSVLDNQCLGIQGRPLPFNDTDMVTLGVKLPTTATYTIAINTTDGLFASAQQNIYLEDTALNIIHDLRQAPYVFTAAAGRFDTRFVLRYTNSNPLGTDDFTTLNNSVVVATPNPNQMNITSAIENMKSVAVYDILGRVVYTNTSVNASQLLISDVVLNQQALIVRITLENGQIVTRKVVL